MMHEKMQKSTLKSDTSMLNLQLASLVMPVMGGKPSAEKAVDQCPRP
jgi:hypothetical protein